MVSEVRTWMVAAAFLALAPPAAAAGQERPARDSAGIDTTRVLPHPEVVVRALRTPLAAGDVPFAVTVREPSADVPTAGLSLDAPLRTVPGLQVQNRYNDALGDRIVIRGFGARAQFGVRGIHVLVDGVPATMPDGQTALSHLDLAVLDRAEVLRGPAASAYGNAAGGVMLLSTLPPPAERYRQEAAAMTGSDGLLRLRTTAGGSSGNAGWVAALTRQTTENFRPHAEASRYHLSGRAGVPFAGGYARLVLHGVSYDAENPGALTWDQYTSDPHQAQGFNVAQATGEEGRHGQAGLTWERPLDWSQLETTVYALGRAVENPIPPTIIDLDRLAGGARVLLRSRGQQRTDASWALGLDAALQGDDRKNFDNVEGERGALTLDQDERVSNIALHAQGMVPLAAAFAVYLGARYDRVSFSADDHLLEDDPDDSGTRTMHAVSPSLGLRLELASEAMLFANVSTAFETPTTTELVNRPDGAGGFNQELEPQRTLSYELGGRAAVGRFNLEASVYHARVKDGLVPFEVASAPGRQYFRNASETTHRGLELQAAFSAERLDIVAAYSRTLAEFESYETAEQSYDGLTVPGVRPWTVAVRTSGRPLEPLAFEVDYQKTGAMPADDANEASAPGYDLVAVRAAGPLLRTGRLRARPYAGVDNLLDQTHVASVVPNAFGGRFFEPGPGRTFFIGLETRFSAGPR